MKKILCIYTCKKDKKNLQKIKRTKWYKNILDDEEFIVFDVYADAKIKDKYIFKKNLLIVREKEIYRGLSLKTYSMISACLNIDFDFLIKMDSTVVDIEKVKRKEESFDNAKGLILDDKFYKEYNGTCLHKSNYPWAGLKRWGIRKNIGIVYPEKALVDIKRINYFCGKTYVLNREFCEYIEARGRGRALDFYKYMGGSEDLMIGCLHAEYKRGVKNVK